MKWHSNSTTKDTGAQTPAESVRRAGIKSIFISIFVAGSTYYSLTLIAKYFGGSLGSDAYFFLASLSTLASGLIGSLMGTVFLPAFITLLARPNKNEAQCFASSMFSWCLIISCVIALPTAIWNEQFFLFASRFDENQISQMYKVLVYFAPIFILSVLTEFFRVISLSIGRFSTAALAAIFPPLFIILFVILFGNTLKEEALVVSLLMAKFIALIMLVIVARGEGVRVSFNLTKNSHTFRFIKSSAPYCSANAITNAATFYFDYQASGLGTGVVTALAYAGRIFMLPITVFINPLVEISRTKYAHLHSIGNRVEFNNYYNNLIRVAVYSSIPIAAIYIMFSQEIISAMFQRGEFKSDSVKMTASCLAIYAWSIPFAAVFLVNGRACESFQRLLWPSFFGTIGNLLMITTTFLLVNELGYTGIPLTRVLTEVFYLLPFGFLSVQLFGGSPQYFGITRSLVASLISILPAAAIYNIDFFKRYDGSPFSLPLIIIYSLIFFLIYFLLLMIFSIELRRKVFFHFSKKI